MTELLKFLLPNLLNERAFKIPKLHDTFMTTYMYFLNLRNLSVTKNVS